jgi:hypothetical protein
MKLKKTSLAARILMGAIVLTSLGMLSCNDSSTKKATTDTPSAAKMEAKPAVVDTGHIDTASTRPIVNP